MRLRTWLIGTSCLLLMALFVALFAIAHQAEAADDLSKRNRPAEAGLFRR